MDEGGAAKAPPPSKVLLVEDDPLNLQVCKRWLESHGFLVRATTSAEQALAALEQEEFAAILLDNILPGMTGLQAIASLSARSSAAIVVMTGHADVELRKDALLLGAKAFLKKPLDFDQLVIEIGKAVASK